MSRFQLSETDARIFALEGRLKRFRDYAIAHSEWEAKVLCHESPWFDGMPGDLMTGFESLQVLRNAAMDI